MGRGYNTDFVSHQCDPDSNAMHKIASVSIVGPTNVVVNRLRTVDGVPVGNRRERRMAARVQRQQAKDRDGKR